LEFKLSRTYFGSMYIFMIGRWLPPQGTIWER
jgi:hypothetical protein